MKFNIRGEKVKITPAINDYIEDKIGRLDKFMTNAEDVSVNVLVRLSGNMQIIEVTLPLKKVILRGEERHEDLYAAIDLVSEKLERQIRKNKTKIKDKIDHELLRSFKITKEEEAETKEKIVRRKTLEMKPMDEEEAILQMDLLGHDFFVYHDYKIDAICVLYRRKDGKYGLIVTE